MTIETGDRVVFTHRYASAYPGMMGIVVHTWVPPDGKGQQQVRVFFGRNLTGQRLGLTVPINVLRKDIPADDKDDPPEPEQAALWT